MIGGCSSLNRHRNFWNSFAYHTNPPPRGVYCCYEFGCPVFVVRYKNFIYRHIERCFASLDLPRWVCSISVTSSMANCGYHHYRGACPCIEPGHSVVCCWLGVGFSAFCFPGIVFLKAIGRGIFPFLPRRRVRRDVLRILSATEFCVEALLCQV